MKEKIPPSALTWLTARESYETMLRPLREAWTSTMQQPPLPRPDRGTGIGEPDRIGEYLDEQRSHQIEHIWANHFERYQDLVKNRAAFDRLSPVLAAQVEQRF